MKRIVLLAVIGLMFSGCVSSVAQMYDTTKTIYVKGKEVVIINSDLLDDGTIGALNDIDEKAVRINDTKVAVEKVDGSGLLDDATAERIRKTKEAIYK